MVSKQWLKNLQNYKLEAKTFNIFQNLETLDG